MPELDDEFASEVSEFDTLAEYKEDVKKDLATKKEAEVARAKEDQVIAAIIEDAQMDIPDIMVASHQRQMLDEYAQRIQMQGLNIDQYFQYTGLTKETFLEQIKPQALSRIQSRLVLEAIVAAESIVPSEEEFEAELVKMASMYQMELDKVKEMIGDAQKEEVMKDIAIAKAATFAVENAKEGKATKAKAAADKETPAKKAAPKKPAAKKTKKAEETAETAE